METGPHRAGTGGFHSHRGQRSSMTLGGPLSIHRARAQMDYKDYKDTYNCTSSYTLMDLHPRRDSLLKAKGKELY